MFYQNMLNMMNDNYNTSIQKKQQIINLDIILNIHFIMLVIILIYKQYINYN